MSKRPRMSHFISSVIGPVAVIALFCSACAGNPVETGTDQRSVEVLSALLRHEECRTKRPGYYIVDDGPLVGDEFDIAKEKERGGQTNLDQWAQRDAIQAWPHVEICAAARVVSSSEIDALFDKDHRIPPGWEAFFAAYPDAVGITRVSIPVFTRDSKKAALYVTRSCGLGCDARFYFELTRTATGWRVARCETRGIS